MRKINLYIAIAASAFIASCKTNLETNEVSAGTANFKRYVAIGNSLTSGYADGALSYTGQMNSFPNMLAQQFSLAGGGEFKIPYMNQTGGGNDGGNNPSRVLGYVIPCGSTSPSLSPVLNPKGTTAFNNVSAQGPYNLVGVPGAKAIDVNWNLYSFGNPFFQRFAATPGVSTMLSEAMRVNPTFFTLWLGNNDVLAYATSGAPALTANLLDPRLSDSIAVRNSISLMVDTLVKSGAKGAIANIPDVTSIPYFTTVPWNSVVLTQGAADTLNLVYSQNGLPITWTAGANGLLIVDSTAPAAMRHATAEDLILITTPGDSIRCAKWGVFPNKPLKDSYVLDKAEIATIKEYTNSYNTSIANIASANGLALVDMNAYMKKLQAGIMFNGVTMNAKFISGGAFSLDGVHPNPRGYALIANEFIRVINAKFGSSLPSVNVNSYNGIVFP